MRAARWKPFPTEEIGTDVGFSLGQYAVAGFPVAIQY